MVGLYFVRHVLNRSDAESRKFTRFIAQLGQCIAVARQVGQFAKSQTSRVFTKNAREPPFLGPLISTSPRIFLVFANPNRPKRSAVQDGSVAGQR